MEYLHLGCREHQDTIATSISAVLAFDRSTHLPIEINPVKAFALHKVGDIISKSLTILWLHAFPQDVERVGLMVCQHVISLAKSSTLTAVEKVQPPKETIFLNLVSFLKSSQASSYGLTEGSKFDEISAKAQCTIV